MLDILAATRALRQNRDRRLLSGWDGSFYDIQVLELSPCVCIRSAKPFAR